MVLKALCVADFHGDEKALAQLAEILEKEKPGVVVIAGDLTQFGKPEDYAKRALEIVRAGGAECVAVHGNTDTLQVKLFLEKEGVSVHNKKKIVNGIEFVGYGGSSPTPFTAAITYSEAQIYADLAKIVSKQSVLVSHAPPYGLPLELDRTFDLKHAGSKSIRKIVDEKRPRACVCAHVHERSGETNVLGCRVIKLAPLRDGKYAVVEFGAVDASMANGASDAGKTNSVNAVFH